ncbi:class I SAM-dependent methyltransferase [Actinoplanes sp. NPDC051633]|uniref:class I SAM-dependent methyltransferase n=1 Tax=Actinoplanes sp. NPDC051633 TaxID=3155670 RepID=UPI003412BCB7
MKLRVPEMEGRSARWYAKQRGSAAQMAQYRRIAEKLSEQLPPGCDVLEVAPGPGYHAIEMARLGHAVTGLDISRTMVEIAGENAARAGVTAGFRHGDATAMPFPDSSFDFIVCQAAFKNFLDPIAALDEMHRVLRPGGLAVIQDLNSAATRADIAAEVAPMGLSRVNAAFVRFTLSWLRRRARTAEQFRELAGRSAFGRAEVGAEGLSLEVRLRA